MAVLLPRNMQDEELMARSVMDEPRNPYQRITDMLFGRTPSEQWTNAFTSIIPLRVLQPASEGLAALARAGKITRPWPGIYKGRLSEGLTQPISYIRPRTFELAPITDAEREALLRSLGVR